MDLPVEKWYKAIGKRRSCRRYFPQYLSQELVYHLWHVITKLNETRRSARIELLTESPDPVLKGIIGPFGKIRGARAYAAFIGATEDEHVAEETGYLGNVLSWRPRPTGWPPAGSGALLKPAQWPAWSKRRRERKCWPSPRWDSPMKSIRQEVINESPWTNCAPGCPGNSGPPGRRGLWKQPAWPRRLATASPGVFM